MISWYELKRIVWVLMIGKKEQSNMSACIEPADSEVIQRQFDHDIWSNAPGNSGIQRSMPEWIQQTLTRMSTYSLMLVCFFCIGIVLLFWILLQLLPRFRGRRGRWFGGVLPACSIENHLFHFSESNSVQTETNRREEWCCQSREPSFASPTAAGTGQSLRPGGRHQSSPRIRCDPSEGRPGGIVETTHLQTKPRS